MNYVLTEDQEKAINGILTGLDIVACMPTGSGKSLIFQALALSCKERDLKNIVMIIVTPLRSISFTHRQAFEKINVGCLDINEDPVDDFKNSDFNAVLANPEILFSQKGEQVLEIIQKKCRLFVIDEAHCLKNWGEGTSKKHKPFRKLFKELANVIALLQMRPNILCMTATMTEVTETATIKTLGISSKNLFKIERNPVNPRISYINSKGDLNIQYVAELLKKQGIRCPRILIFKHSLVDCGLCYLEIKKILEEAGCTTNGLEVYHSQIPKDKQEEIAKSLLDEDGQVRVVIATSALSMGFDATGINYVIHTEMPKKIEDFIQMTGRTGRKDGIEAYCLLFTEKKPRDADLSSNQYRTQNEICRRKSLAQYFPGEMLQFDSTVNVNDTCCDFCGPTGDEVLMGLITSRDTLNCNQGPVLEERHRTTAVDRRDLRNALEDLMDQINYGTIPFLDSGLTEGIIKLIVQQCHKICHKEDLDALVPGLSHSTQLEIIEILSNIFAVIEP